MYQKPPSNPHDLLVGATLLSLSEFKALERLSSENGKDPYRLSHISAFASPGAAGEKFHEAVQGIYDYSKLLFHQEGLMLGYMSPLHAPGGRNGGSEPVFISKLPLLIARKMHKSDHIFMRNPQEKAAYEKFFGKSQS